MEVFLNHPFFERLVPIAVMRFCLLFSFFLKRVLAFYFLSSLSAACSIYSGSIIDTENKSNIGSNATLRVEVIDELEVKNFCLDTQMAEDITAWYFSREDTLIKQAIFYKSENKLILKIGDQTSGYLNAYSYQNPRYDDLPHFCFEQNSAVSLTAH